MTVLDLNVKLITFPTASLNSKIIFFLMVILRVIVELNKQDHAVLYTVYICYKSQLTVLHFLVLLYVQNHSCTEAETDGGVGQL